MIKAINYVFVIAEAGVNHNGSFEKAIDMIHLAKEASVDAVKFQTYITEKRVKKKYHKIFDILNIQHRPIGTIEKKNTNVGAGLVATEVYKKDVMLLKKFISKIPSKHINDLKYMRDSLQTHEKNLEEYRND